MKNLNLLMILVILISLSGMTGATGLAIGLNDLYLQNNTAKPVKLKISNLPESTNTIEVKPHAICNINQNIMFLPYPEESNNFVIMINNESIKNPIIIDQFGLLALASDSVIKADYFGPVKMHSLLGFCGNNLGQYKFLNVTPHDNESSAPNFILKNCNKDSHFVYFINDSYIKVKKRPKYIDFSRVSSCRLAESTPSIKIVESK